MYALYIHQEHKQVYVPSMSESSNIKCSAGMRWARNSSVDDLVLFKLVHFVLQIQIKCMSYLWNYVEIISVTLTYISYAWTIHILYAALLPTVNYTHESESNKEKSLCSISEAHGAYKVYVFVCTLVHISVWYVRLCTELCARCVHRACARVRVPLFFIVYTPLYRVHTRTYRVQRAYVSARVRARRRRSSSERAAALVAAACC